MISLSNVHFPNALEKCLDLAQFSKSIVGSQIHLMDFQTLVQNAQGFLTLKDLRSKKFAENARF